MKPFSPEGAQLSVLVWSLGLGIVCAVIFIRARDYYVVVREFRIVEPNEFGKGKTVESRHVHHFNDYAAARAFYDLHNTYAAIPDYENQQNINYLYAVPAFTAKRAGAKMRNNVHHEAKLLAETPFSVLSALKRHWDEERKARASRENPVREVE
jgi:hypothetical protein